MLMVSITSLCAMAKKHNKFYAKMASDSRGKSQRASFFLSMISNRSACCANL